MRCRIPRGGRIHLRASAPSLIAIKHRFYLSRPQAVILARNAYYVAHNLPFISWRHAARMMLLGERVAREARPNSHRYLWQYFILAQPLIMLKLSNILHALICGNIVCIDMPWRTCITLANIYQ